MDARSWGDGKTVALPGGSFHREVEFLRLGQWLRRQRAREGPATLVISSDGLDAGVDELLATWRARPSEERHPGLWRIELGGYEPDHPSSLLAFGEFQLASQTTAARLGLDAADGPALREKLLRGVGDIAARSEERDWVALVVAVLLAADDPLAGFAQVLAGEASSLRASFEGWLRCVAEPDGLLLFFADHAELGRPTKAALFETVAAVKGLGLIFGCHIGEKTDAVVGAASQGKTAVERLELDRLGQQEQRVLLDQRLKPCRLPENVWIQLWKKTAGAPARVNRRVAELYATGVLARDPAGGTRWATDVEDLAGWISPIGAELDAMMAAHPEAGSRLPELLLLGALCGEVFPPKVLLKLIGVEEEEADALIDLIDEELVERLGWIEDLEFRHPGFPGLQVYRIAQPALRDAVLGADDDNYSLGSRQLLEAFAELLPPWTRGAALLHLALARHLGPAYAQKALATLAWLVGPEHEVTLAALVARQLAAREIEGDELFRLALTSKHRWPSFRRLVLLDAWAESRSSIPAGWAPLHALERAWLLYHLGRFDPAVDAALAARGLHGDGVTEAGMAARMVHGLALRQVGRLAESTQVLEEAYRLSQVNTGFSEKSRVALQEAYVGALAAQGDLEKALALAEDNVAEFTRLFGDDHPDTFVALARQAGICAQLGQVTRARLLFGTALAGLEQSLGPGHPVTRRVAHEMATLTA